MWNQPNTRTISSTAYDMGVGFHRDGRPVTQVVAVYPHAQPTLLNAEMYCFALLPHNIAIALSDLSIDAYE